jgi:hypothetical protein
MRGFFAQTCSISIASIDKVGLFDVVRAAGVVL